MSDQKSEQEKDKDADPRVPLRSDESHTAIHRTYFRYVHKNAALPTSGRPVPGGRRYRCRHDQDVARYRR